MPIYCTYITLYHGKKLPPFYLGSSSVKKISEGYHGSVCSKQFKEVWKDEIKSNPDLFTTRILTTHSDRKDATLREHQLQMALRVVKNPLYINQSYAAHDSFSDRDQTGKNNPMHGSHRAGNKNPFYGRTHSDETKQKMRGRKCTEENKKLYRKLKVGTKMTAETKQSMSIAKKGKAPNSASILPTIMKTRFMSLIATKRDYTYINACQQFPDLKCLFWSKKLQ